MRIEVYSTPPTPKKHYQMILTTENHEAHVNLAFAEDPAFLFNEILGYMQVFATNIELVITDDGFMRIISRNMIDKDLKEAMLKEGNVIWNKEGDICFTG